MRIRLVQYFPRYFWNRKLHFSLYFIAALLLAGSAHAEFGPRPTSEDIIREMYVAYYGRPADAAGLAFWATFLDEKGDFNNLMAEFGNSPEYTNHYGSLNNGELIDALYQQMFSRLPDPVGREFYVNRLNSGEVSLGLIAKQIADGATGDDDLALRNKVRVSVPWTEYYDGIVYYYAPIDVTEVKAVIALVSSEPESLARGMISVSQFLHGEFPECPGCIWTDSSQSLEITVLGTWVPFHWIANIVAEDIPPLALEYLRTIKLTTEKASDYCVSDLPTRVVKITDTSGVEKSFFEVRYNDCYNSGEGIQDWEISLLLNLLPEYEGYGSWSDLLRTPPIVTPFSVKDKFGQESDSFVVGDEVHIDYRVKNTSAEALGYSTTLPGHQLTIIGKGTASGNFWNKHHDQAFVQVVSSFVLEAGEELVFDVVWTGVDNYGNPVEPGPYEIRPNTSISIDGYYHGWVHGPDSVFITLQ